MEGASRIPLELLQANPGDVPALEQLASILSDVGDAARLEPVVQRLVQEAPKSTWSHYYASSLFFHAGPPRPWRSRPRATRISIDPANAKAHNLIGASLGLDGSAPTRPGPRSKPRSRPTRGIPAPTRTSRPSSCRRQSRSRPQVLRRSADDRSVIADRARRPDSIQSDEVRSNRVNRFAGQSVGARPHAGV